MLSLLHGSAILLLFINLQPVCAFDWGDFHKLAVIFFSFFGPCVILGSIAIVAYFACLKSWYESYREEVRETHRSSHPWPPGSAKWQLQQYVKAGGQLPPISVKGDSSKISSIPISELQPTKKSQSMHTSPIPPGRLVSPQPQSNTQQIASVISLQPPSIVIPPDMTTYQKQSPLPPRATSPQYYPHSIISQQRPASSYLTPSHSVAERGRNEETILPHDEYPHDIMLYFPSPRHTNLEPLEAITVRTTTTTRRTTVLSPVCRTYTNV